MTGGIRIWIFYCSQEGAMGWAIWMDGFYVGYNGDRNWFSWDWHRNRDIAIDHCSWINYDLKSANSNDSLEGVIYIGIGRVQGDELKYWDRSICLLRADKASNQYIESALANTDKRLRGDTVNGLYRSIRQTKSGDAKLHEYSKSH